MIIRHKHNIKAFIYTITITCILLFGGPVGCSSNTDKSIPFEKKSFEKGSITKSTETMVVETESLRMNFNPVKCTFDLIVKDTEAIWSSNPPDEWKDPYAASITKTDLKSQLLVTYKIDNTKMRNTNSVVSSVNKKTFTVARLKNGIRVDYTFREGFVIPVMYELFDDSMEVSILFSEIEETTEQQINEIKLLPYFGAASESEKGYLFVPDGSGAIIDFNNKKTDYPVYDKMVYGNDQTLPSDIVTTRAEQIHFPVFGMKKENGAFVAVIEDGDGFARIQASVAGKNAAFNTVNSTAIYRAVERLNVLNGSLGTAGAVLYSAEDPVRTNSYRVRYTFLSGQDSSIGGMAKSYRNRLIEQKALTASEKETALYIDIYGGVKKAKSFLGIRYDGGESLTSFSQTRDLLDDLRREGADSLVVGFRNLSRDSYKGKPETSFKPLSELGGKKGLDKLLDYVKENEIPFYAYSDFYSFEKSGNSLSKYFNVCKTLDLGAAQVYYKKLNTNIQNKTRDPFYLLYPTGYQKAVSNMIKSADNNKIDAIHLGDISSRLAGDYSRGGLQRDQAINALKSALDMAADKSLMLKSPNSYLLEYADYITDLPMTSEKNLLFDRDVPFLQMVLKGSLSYAAYSANLNSTSDDLFLHQVESMSQIHYSFISDNPSDLLNTDMVDLYGLSLAQRELAVAQYKAMLAISQTVNNAYIDEYSGDGSVSEIKYSNGVTIYVNFTNENVEFGEISIPSRGYAVVRNGKMLLSGNEVRQND
ncbi:MAG: DUF5696 domain-containing protein [Oscillospiraceae bacterium]|nr:DUF5696 domain-containing protein [Oscillospiraceae bacterium]